MKECKNDGKRTVKVKEVIKAKIRAKKWELSNLQEDSKKFKEAN